MKQILTQKQLKCEPLLRSFVPTLHTCLPRKFFETLHAMMPK